MADKSGAFLGGVLLGTAIGSIVGLLLAPRSGRETRVLLKQSVESIPEVAEDAADSAHEQIDRLVQSARRSLDETIGKLNETIEAGHAVNVAVASQESNETTTPPPTDEPA